MFLRSRPHQLPIFSQSLIFSLFLFFKGDIHILQCIWERVLRRTQQHNGRSDIGVMIAVSNRDPLDYPAGVTDRGEDVNIVP